MSEQLDEVRMVSVRQKSRRSDFGKGLMILSGVLLVIGVIGSIMVPWSDISEVRSNIAKRTEETPNRFLAPGSMTVDLPPGRVFIEYFTDDSLEDVRYITSSELVFEITITDAEGVPLEIEHEATQRANLPSSRPGKKATAVLIGTAAIPSAGPHEITLTLPPGESSEAVAEILIIDSKDQDRLLAAVWPGIGFGCGLGGGVFFGIVGCLAIWIEKRAGMNQ